MEIDAKFSTLIDYSDHRQVKVTFPNGYGASVINDGYGRQDGLFEVGVLDHGHLTYQTPLTDDVLGYLTAEQVTETLDQIAALPAAVACAHH